MKTKDLKNKLAEEAPKRFAPDFSKGLSTGSTLLNLACSGKMNVGFIGGRYYFFVGDSSSGKTFLTMTVFAEACKNEHFKDHRLIYDSPEMGADMDWAKFFGETAANKIENTPSSSLEDFYYGVDRDFDDGRPFIRVVDSMDALVPKAALKKFDEDRKADEGNKEAKGSYATDKAKINSSHMPILFNRLREEGKSIIILISQTRDNIGFGAMFDPKTRSGGHALTFYAALEMWTSIRERIKVKYKGKDREQGIVAKIRVKKNRLTGKDRSVLVPILHSHGIDDNGSMVDWLIEEGIWKESKGTVHAPEFDFSGSAEALVRHIEEGNKERKLRMIVGQAWNEIENAVRVERKKRYE
jgi:RecA/RadA recombinase